jgi:hypothetical protein
MKAPCIWIFHLRWLCVAILTSLGSFLHSQEPELEWQSEQYEITSEEEAERQEEMSAGTILTISINYANSEQLSSLPGMSVPLADAIVAFRDSTGFFLSVYELLSVPGATVATIRTIAPWLTFEPLTEKGFRHTGAIRWSRKNTSRLQSLSPGATPLGPPWKLSLKYKTEQEHWLAGLKVEKDAGEPFGGSYRPEGFDFWSGYLGYRSNKILRQAIAGDYRVSMGTGMLCNMSFNAGGDASALYHPHDHRIIRPHTSTDEYLYFRGAAVHLRRNGWMLTVFGSFKPLDGNITSKDSITNKVLSVSSIQISGIHSTPNELMDRHILNELAAGGRIRYCHHSFVASINALSLKYSIPLIPEQSYSNRNKFSGTSMNGVSFDFGWYNKHMGTAVEIAEMQQKVAATGIILFKASDQVTLWFSSRYYSPGYPSPYATSPGRGSWTDGEVGLNGMMIFSPEYGTSYKLIVDQYHILTTGVAPVTGKTGRQLSGEAVSSFNGIQWKMRVFLEQYSENRASLPTENLAVKIEEKFTGMGVKLKMSTNLTEQGRISTGIIWRKRSDLPGANGWLMSADVDYRLFENRIKMIARVMIWDVDDYNLRIYSREQDAEGAFSMSMPYGNGCRTYFLFCWKPTPEIQIWCKAGLGRNLKPGAGETDERTSDISLQVNLKF